MQRENQEFNIENNDVTQLSQITIGRDDSEDDALLTPIHSQAAARLNLPTASNPPQPPRRERIAEKMTDDSDSDHGPPSPSPRNTPRSGLGLKNFGKSLPKTPLRKSAFGTPRAASRISSSRVTPRRLFYDAESHLSSLAVPAQALSQSLQQVKDASRESSPEPDGLPVAFVTAPSFVCSFDSSELGYPEASQASEPDEPFQRSQLSQSHRLDDFESDSAVVESEDESMAISEQSVFLEEPPLDSVPIFQGGEQLTVGQAEETPARKEPLVLAHGQGQKRALPTPVTGPAQKKQKSDGLQVSESNSPCISPSKVKGERVDSLSDVYSKSNGMTQSPPISPLKQS